MIFDDGGGKGPIAKFLVPEAEAAIRDAVGIGPGDAVFFVCDQPAAAAAFAGTARTKLGEELGLIDDSVFRFCWTVDFPMYEREADTGTIQFSHNPFSMPQGGLKALEAATDPEDILAWQYDIVCNGVELSSGAIRNHRPDIMVKAFAIAGYSLDDLETQFPALLHAFRYGAPPHGGIAPGIDRIVMLLADEPNIREVIPVPAEPAGGRPADGGTRARLRRAASGSPFADGPAADVTLPGLSDPAGATIYFAASPLAVAARIAGPHSPVKFLGSVPMALGHYTNNSFVRQQASQLSAVDAGLRSYMLRIYGYMTAGLGITGVVALAVSSLAVSNGQLTSVGVALYTPPLAWVVMFAPLGVILLMSFRVHRLQATTVQTLFWILAACYGISLSSIFLVYTGESIVRVFFIAASMFLAMSVWGLHHQAIPVGHGVVPLHGDDRHLYRDAGEPVPGILRAPVHDLRASAS